jgi:protease II
VEIHAESVVTLYALHGYAHQAVVVREESLVQPPAWYEIDLATGERRLLKRLEVPGYDASAYRTRRDHATAPRGGGENGRQWWMDGHLEAKTNTFDDHIAIADWLAGAGEGLPEPPGVQSVVDGRRIATRGPSAGGLLQGVAYSRRPYLRVEMGAGAHSGPAGRYAHFLYEAEVLAFALGFIL